MDSCNFYKSAIADVQGKITVYKRRSDPPKPDSCMTLYRKLERCIKNGYPESQMYARQPPVDPGCWQMYRQLGNCIRDEPYYC